MACDCDRCRGNGRKESGKGADPEKKIRGPLVAGLRGDGIPSWCYSCLLDYFKALIAGKTGKVLVPNPYYGKKLRSGASHALFELEFLTIWVPPTPQAQPRWNGKAAGPMNSILAIGKWDLTPDDLVHKAALVEAKLGDRLAKATVANEVKRSNITQCPVCGSVNSPFYNLNLESPCVCWGCVVEAWTLYYDARLGGVENPHYDATSSSPYLYAPFISVSILAKSTPRNVHPLLVIKDARDMHPDEFAKAAAAFDDARSTMNEKKHANERARREMEEAELQKRALKAGVHQLTATEKDTAHKLGVQIIALADRNADLVSVNKVSLKPVGTDDFQIVKNEDTRKIHDTSSALIVNKQGRALARNEDFEAHVFGPDADPGKEIEKLRAKGKKGGPSIHLATFIVTGATTPDDACCSEEKLQGHCNAIDLPNHTEDATYHRGNYSVKYHHAACCVVVWIGALTTVADGRFFWSSSMPLFMMGRLWSGYEKFRPLAAWHGAQIEDAPEDASQSTMDKFLAGSKAGAPKPKPNARSAKPREPDQIPDTVPAKVELDTVVDAVITFTGRPSNATVKQLGELAVKLGAEKYIDNVTAETTLLVVFGKPGVKLSGKELKARDRGIPIMQGADLMALMKGATSKTTKLSTKKSKSGTTSPGNAQPFVPAPQKSSSMAPGKATSPGNAQPFVRAPQKSSSMAPGKATSPGNAKTSVPDPKKSSSAAPGKAASPATSPGNAKTSVPAPKMSSSAAPGKANKSVPTEKLGPVSKAGAAANTSASKSSGAAANNTSTKKRPLSNNQVPNTSVSSVSKSEHQSKKKKTHQATLNTFFAKKK
ncbi:hypothetical protein ACHAXT_012236 [Thalassiosira profunda]